MLRQSNCGLTPCLQTKERGGNPVVRVPAALTEDLASVLNTQGRLAAAHSPGSKGSGAHFWPLGGAHRTCIFTHVGKHSCT